MSEEIFNPKSHPSMIENNRKRMIRRSAPKFRKYIRLILKELEKIN
jgi:hypothetical protein